MEDSPSLNVVVFWEDFSCVVVVVSTVFTISFFIVLFVVVCVVLSFVVLSFVVLSFVLGGEEDSVVVLLEVVDSFVVVLGVEGCVVVASDVDFSVAVLDVVLFAFVLVIEVSVVFTSVAFKTEVGVATVPFVVELLVEAVEFGDVALDFTSVTFCVDVPLVEVISV